MSNDVSIFTDQPLVEGAVKRQGGKLSEKLPAHEPKQYTGRRIR